MKKLQSPEVQREDRSEEEEDEARQESAEQLDGIVSELLSPYLQEWEKKLEAAMKDGLQQDVNALWNMWNWLAEEAHIYMQERGTVHTGAQSPKLPGSARGLSKKLRGRARPAWCAPPR